MHYTSMYKSELAAAAGVCRTTFWNWLKTDRDALAAMHVSIHCHKLPARAVKYLDQKYCIF